MNRGGGQGILQKDFKMRAAFSHSWSRVEGQKASFFTLGAGPDVDRRLRGAGFEADFRLSQDNSADTRCMAPSSRASGHGERRTLRQGWWRRP